MANAIITSGAYETPPPLPQAVNSIRANLAINSEFTDSSVTLSISTQLGIDTATQTFADGSSITTAIFSEETPLGTYEADSNGALHTIVDVADVTTG